MLPIKHPFGDEEPSEWGLLENLYFEGLNLDIAERAILLEPYRHLESLMEELEALWNHEVKRLGFLEVLPKLSRTLWRDLSEEEKPEWVGNYKILAKLGQGGMGVVYKALQPAPLSRPVAIKVLPRILCTSSWLTRFEIEQKALGSLSHPNIATVHDAGITGENQPFLVMEMLDGMDIRSYCDGNRLTAKARLELFCKICEGVNHAHRRGILHRDLKPSNLLVIEKDDSPTPVIIDFGIAELFRNLPKGSKKQIVGTPKYMSPEQASLIDEAVDTRSDIYALGVLLFELLLGKTPLEEELEKVNGFKAQCSLIRKCRFRSLAAQANSQVEKEAAYMRSTTPKQLAKTLRGELDWIAMKSLARDPNDRYDSVFDLMRDIQRYGQNQTVSAGFGRRGYYLKKWLSQHLVTSCIGATVLIVMSVALIVTLMSLNKARALQKDLQNVQAFSEGMFREVGPYFEGRDVKAIDLLNHAAEKISVNYAGQPKLEKTIRLVIARSYRDLGLYDEAETHFARAEEIALVLGLANKSEALLIKGERAYNLFEKGDRKESMALYDQAQQSSIRIFGWESPTSWNLSHGLAVVLGRDNQQEKALVILKEVLKRQKLGLGEGHRETLATMNNMSDLLLATGNNSQAESLLRQALALYGSLDERKDPFAASLTHNLALALSGQGHVSEAIALNRNVLQARKVILGHYHPNTLTTANNLATGIGNSGFPDQAIQLIEQTLVGFPIRGMQSTEYLRIRHTLGHFLMVHGDFDKAKAVLEDTWESRKDVLGPSHIDTLKTHITLGELLCKTGQPDEGLKQIEAAIFLAEKSMGKSHPKYQVFQNVLQWAKKKKSDSL